MKIRLLFSSILYFSLFSVLSFNIYNHYKIIHCKFFNSDCSTDYILNINKQIITVSIISQSFLDIAINYYLSSIKKFKIFNYLFVSTDSISYQLLKEMNILLINNMIINNSKSNSDYKSKNYGVIVRSKVPVVYRLLILGLKVLFIDPDIHFFKNPIYFFNSYHGFDLVISEECKNYKEINSGE